MPERSAGAVSCVCCGEGMVLRWAGLFDDRYGHPGRFDLYCCARCGHGQTVPMLREEDLPELYGRYYPRSEVDVDALRRQVGDPGSAEARRRRWREGTDNQGQYATRPGMKVLDYGCGTGVSLLEIQALGGEAYGIEADPNVRPVAEALGLRIHFGSLDDDPFPGERFDLIVLNQVLEHIPDPLGLLGRLRERLAPGGRLILSFPNAASFYARLFGRRWINWHVPYHLHHFTRRSCRELFRRGGWRVRQLRTITPNLWTVLQCRAAAAPARHGSPHPLWTGSREGGGAEEPQGWRRWLERTAVGAGRPVPAALLTALNRTLDAAGAGDSLLVEVVPGSDG